MHIAIISVAPPYRGGISQHTSILAKKLSERHLVKVINYKRQYPNIIFPGRTQYLTSNHILGERCIDSINPLNWFRVGKKLVSGQFDLIIFRIWHPFFSPVLGTIALQLRKNSANTKLISLCDNILPHENMPFGFFLSHHILKKMHGHLVQSIQTEIELKKILQSPIFIKRLHPIYDVFPVKIEKKVAKEKLGIISDNIILFFGFIRPYKGFDILLRAISLLKGKKLDFHLLVVGECYEKKDIYTRLIHDLEISKFVTWIESYVPDNEVPIYFSAASIVALPYRSASQSGIVQIAYHYDIPVIVSRVGGLPEIVKEGKSGFIMDLEDHHGLAKILSKYISKSNFNKMSQYINDFKSRFSWEYFIDGIEEIYSKI